MKKLLNKAKSFIFGPKDERPIKEQLRDHPYLDIPESLWDVPDEMLADICNGCGAAGKFDFVPETMWRLRISVACFVHDYRYWLETTLEGKRSADMQMITNIIRIIDYDQDSWAIGRFFRGIRSSTYYRAVYEAGFIPFWKGKEDAILNTILFIIQAEKEPLTEEMLSGKMTLNLGVSLETLEKEGHPNYLQTAFGAKLIQWYPHTELCLTQKGLDRITELFNLDTHREKKNATRND